MSTDMGFYTANWYPMGDVYYRKFNLYQMKWSVQEDFKDCLVAVGPYGGSIALLKNLTKEKISSSRPVLEIYTSSGVLISTILWKSGPVLKLGWTVSEDLICIQEDGTVLLYDLFCAFKRHFSMGSDTKQNQVLEAKVFHSEYKTGIAILTGTMKFTLSSNIDDFKLLRMPEIPGLQVPPSCWTVIFQDRRTLILVAIEKDLYLLEDRACSIIALPGMSPLSGAYLHMSVSFHSKYLAVFTDSGYMWMGASSLKEKLCEFNSDMKQSPNQVTWCIRPQSNHLAVIITWDKILLIAGKEKHGILYWLIWFNNVVKSLHYQCMFPLDEETFMVPELDGVHLISHSKHEFLHEVPKTSIEIFKIASMAPGALLMEAQKEYEKQSQKADEYLREIKDQNLLSLAVSQCIEAAGYEHAPEIQKSLLRAASFGKCFLESYAPSEFVTMCRNLRVLNAINENQIGIPLSIMQYKQLTVPVLLDRLVLRRLYPLAVKICEYLKQPDIQGVSRVLAHWACYKVQQKEKSDEEVAHAINQKLGETPGISYSEIASRACDCGRIELAIRLLEYEPKSEDQVPLLLKMKRSNLALGKAIESGDTDLMYTVVSYMKHELNRGDFFMTLQNYPAALSLYRQFCKHQEPETLKDLYNQDDNHQELGNYHVRSSYYTEKRVEGRVAELQNAVDEYNKAKNDWAVKVTEDQIKLLRIQRGMQDKLDKPYLDFSLHDTVYNLVLNDMQKKAEQLHKELKIPEKRYWWLKLSALAEKEDWQELENFSKSKKPPIGYLVWS
ncbi:vacuolar protein sorting-associated protein 16 homolog [Gastrophryne carolinensis]